MGLKSMFRSLLLGAGAGAAVVYFNDPDRGDERREQFMRKASAKAEDAKGMIEQAKSEVAERTDDSNASGMGDKSGSGMGTSSGMSGTTGSGMGSSGTTPGSGMGTPGTSSGPGSVDLTDDKSTTLPADDLIVPGDRSM